MYLRDVLSTQAERYPDIMAPMPTSVDILLVRVRVYKSLYTVICFICFFAW